MLSTAFLLPLFAATSFAVAAADIDRKAYYEPSAQLLARLKPGPDGKRNSRILNGKEAQLILAHVLPRAAGDPFVAGLDGPEMHWAIDVFYYVVDGKADIAIGTKLEGATESTKNEWGGGKIVDKKVYSLSKGDILWMPAGTAKTITVPPGGSFTYLVVRHDSAEVAENAPKSTK